MPFKKYGFLGQEAKNKADEIRNNYNEHFLLVNQINELTNDIVSTILVNPDDLQESLIHSLLAKIIHSFNSAIILAQYGLESDCNTLLRSLLETLFIFQAVYNDKNLASQYILSEKAQQLKAANVILNDDDISKYFNKKQIDNIKKEKVSLEQEINNEGIKSFTSEWWSKKADLHNVYQTAYRVFSKDVHSQPVALERFLNLDDNNKLKSIRLGPSVKEIKRNLCTAAGVMLGVVDIICEFKKIDKAEEIKILKDKLQALDVKS